ncbi:MAG: hypothetical protein WCG34_03985, partial [Leptolinea sp.]
SPDRTPGQVWMYFSRGGFSPALGTRFWQCVNPPTPFTKGVKTRFAPFRAVLSSMVHEGGLFTPLGRRFSVQKGGWGDSVPRWGYKCFYKCPSNSTIKLK